VADPGDVDLPAPFTGGEFADLPAPFTGGELTDLPAPKKGARSLDFDPFEEPGIAPVLTSMTVSASVCSITREPPDGSHTFVSRAL